MQPRATRAGCRGPAILTRRRNQRRPLMELYHPGALHHAVTIPVLTTIASTSLSPSETARNQIQITMLPTRPHHQQGAQTTVMVGSLLGRGGALVECSQCPPRGLQGSTARRASTIPKQYPTLTAQRNEPREQYVHVTKNRRRPLPCPH